MPSLLFLAHRIPYPPDKGDKIRAWHLLRHLARRFSIHLGCLIDHPDDRCHVETVRAVCAECHFGEYNPRLARVLSLRGLLDGRALTLPYFAHRGLARWVTGQQASHAFAVEFAFSSAMVPYLGPRRADGPSLRVIDFVDVDSDKWAQYAATRHGLARWIYQREARQLALAEQAFAAEADAALFVSEPEAALFRRQSGSERALALSNGVDLDYWSPSPSPGGPGGPSGPPALTVVFTGAMDYWPNIDAVIWFTDQILPLIRQTVPEAGFWIVGTRPTREVMRLAALPGVVVTGRVPDVRPYLAQARVAVAPLRIARGIQNKVLEAMALGTAVVATPQAFEGIEALPGRDLLVAGSATEFAAAVIGLLRDDAAAARLGRQAARTVHASYSWAQRLAPLDRLLEGSTPASRREAAP